MNTINLLLKDVESGCRLRGFILKCIVEYEDGRYAVVQKGEKTYFLCIFYNEEGIVTFKDIHDHHVFEVVKSKYLATLEEQK